MITGLILIIIGAIFLLKNLGFISGGVWEIFWPILLIIVGVNFLIKRRQAGLFWEERFGWRKKIKEKL